MKTPTKKKQMLALLEQNGSNVATACKAVGISRQTHYNWIDKNDSYKKAVEDIEESLKDYVENQLFKNIKKGNVVAQIFYLKSKAKERGYVERIEQEISVNPFMELMKKASQVKKQE